MQVKKFEQLDSLRFIALFMVLIGHWPTFLRQFSEQYDVASMGVNLFFVISGFLITLGLLGNRQREEPTGKALYKFYIRRFLRIFPIYYLTLAVLWVFFHEKVAGSMFWYLAYLSNFYCIHIQNWGGVGHFWSLAVEEQFYLVWPFVILLLPRKWIMPVIGICIILSLAIKLHWWNNHVTFWKPYMHPLGVLDVLALGGLLAWLYKNAPDWLNRLLHNPLFTLIVFLQVWLCFICKDLPAHNIIYHVGIRFSFGLFSAWLVGRSVFGFSGTAGYVLNNRFLQYVGTISYCFYLIHPFVSESLAGLTFPANEELRFVIYFVVTLSICALSWHFFESKILKLKHQFD